MLGSLDFIPSRRAETKSAEGIGLSSGEEDLTAWADAARGGVGVGRRGSVACGLREGGSDDRWSWRSESIAERGVGVGVRVSVLGGADG